MIRRSDNFLMRNATLIAITVITVLTLWTAAIFYQQGEDNLATGRWVNHTYENKGHTQALLNKIVDAETGMRGYLFTGDESFLDPYKDALRDSSDSRPKSDALDQHHSIAEEINILRRMTSDNPRQQQNLDDAEVAANNVLDFMASAIKARKAENGELAAKKIDMRLGRELMDHLRSCITVILLEEDHLLALRIQADEAGTKEGNTVVFSGMIGFYVLLVCAVLVYQRARKRAQAETLRYTEQLERSEEELKMQQEELKASNEEIEASNEELEEQNAQIRQQSEELARNRQLIEEKIREVELASK